MNCVTWYRNRIDQWRDVIHVEDVVPVTVEVVLGDGNELLNEGIATLNSVGVVPMSGGILLSGNVNVFTG